MINELSKDAKWGRWYSNLSEVDKKQYYKVEERRNKCSKVIFAGVLIAILVPIVSALGIFVIKMMKKESLRCHI